MLDIIINKIIWLDYIIIILQFYKVSKYISLFIIRLKAIKYKKSFFYYSFFYNLLSTLVF